MAKSEKALKTWPPESEEPVGCDGPPRSPLLDALKAAGADDLAAVRDRISECERELDALKMAERMLDVRLNGKPEKTPRGTGKRASTAAEMEELANKVFDVITKEGPGRPAQIAMKVGAQPIAVGKAISKFSDWFTRDSYGKVHIAIASGKQVAGNLD